MSESRPDERFLKDLTYKIFVSTIPQGYRFFGRDNSDLPEQLKLFSKGFSDLAGHLLYKIKSAKLATLLKKAWGEYLDLWALEANLQRRVGESDINLRQRVIQAILGLKTSNKGTRDQISSVIAKNGFLLYEAWRELAYLQQPNFKSFISLLHGKTGSSIIMDQLFYRKNTYSVDLFEDEYAEVLALVVQKINEIKAIGVKAFIRQGFQGELSNPIEFDSDIYSTNQELCSSVFESGVFESNVFYEQICRVPRINPFQVKILTNDRRFIKTSDNLFILVNGLV